MLPLRKRVIVKNRRAAVLIIPQPFCFFYPNFLKAVESINLIRFS